MAVIPLSYYQSENTLEVAKDLLGKYLFTSDENNRLFGGIITETEAYLGVTDKASHAYGNKKTKRTAPMFLPGGHSYVYLCYGIHYLFNIVTHKAEIPHAILIRGIYPLLSTQTKLLKKGKEKIVQLNGPGKLTKALGINLQHNALSLDGDKVWLEDRGITFPRHFISSGPRIGVDYAGEDAKLPYRFYVPDTTKLLKHLPVEVNSPD